MSVCRVRPAEVQGPGPEDWQAAWYRTRLYDPSLLDASSVLVLDGVGRTISRCRSAAGAAAVTCSSMTPNTYPLLHQALTALPESPAVRMRQAERPGDYHSLAWGDQRVP